MYVCVCVCVMVLPGTYRACEVRDIWPLLDTVSLNVVLIVDLAAPGSGRADLVFGIRSFFFIT